MALKRFDQMNTPVIHNGEPRIRVDTSGYISFNRKASELLKLTDKSRILLFQDDVQPGDWFIVPADADPTGFTVRKYGKTISYVFNSSSLAKLILKSLSIDDRAVSFRIQPAHQEIEGYKAFLIITSRMVSDKKKR